ncbi:MAG: response regulator [Betaproteobacteria bacterium]|nr:response regulator [Betaproteobacteria bacterium]
MSKKILIVEDNPNNRYLAEFLLESAGFTTCHATTGVEAIERAKSERPDLILMDIQMPEMDGYEATRLLKADSVTRAIPVIGISAFASGDARQAALDSGMSDYITKPIVADVFLPKVKNFLL